MLSVYKVSVCTFLFVNNNKNVKDKFAFRTDNGLEKHFHGITNKEFPDLYFCKYFECKRDCLNVRFPLYYCRPSKIKSALR